MTRPFPAVHARFPRIAAFVLAASLLAALPACAGTDAQVAVPAGALVIQGSWLFDATGDLCIPNPGIVIAESVIVRIGVPEGTPLPDNASRVELSGEDTVIPGLFDLHAHYAVDLPGQGRIDDTTVYPALFLANGVTSTFPAGEVGHWVAQRAHGFKAKGISPEHLEALIQAAHAHGATVTGHLDSGFRNSVNPRDATRMGTDRIEHFEGGDAMPSDRSANASLEVMTPDTPGFRELVALYVEHGTFYNATLTAYGYYGAQQPEVFEDFASEREFLTPWARPLRADARDRLDPAGPGEADRC